jgi:hypothetical protein
MSEISQIEELNHFFEVLEKVSISKDPREPKKLIFDLGLVIFESNSSLKAKSIFNLLPKEKTRFFELKNRYDVDNFLKELVIANREGQWLLVDCQADPSPEIISVLKQLSENNSFTVSNFEERELFQISLNPKTRIIFCINSDFLETKISYPFFMNLFGPVIRI